MDISAADILKLSPSSPSDQQMDMLAMMMMQMDHHQHHHHHQYGSSFQNPNHHLLPENALSFVDSTTAPPPAAPQQLIYNQHNVASSSSSSSPPTITNMPPFLFPTLEKTRICGGSNMASMREMIFRIAVMQPVHIDPESVKPPKRRNVRISKDPQSVAARHRRERISEKIRILQRLVPGGTKMDTASMLDEAIHYVKFLKKQVQSLEQVGANRAAAAMGAVGGFPVNGAAVAGGAVSYNSSGYNMLKGSCQPQPCSSQSQMMTGAMQQVFN